MLEARSAVLRLLLKDIGTAALSNKSRRVEVVIRWRKAGTWRET